MSSCIIRYAFLPLHFVSISLQIKRVKRSVEHESNSNLDAPVLLRSKRHEIPAPALNRIKREGRDISEQLDEALERVKRNKRDVSEQTELVRVKRGDVEQQDPELTRVSNSRFTTLYFKQKRYILEKNIRLLLID